jgi:hypothetical protein
MKYRALYQMNDPGEISIRDNQIAPLGRTAPFLYHDEKQKG